MILYVDNQIINLPVEIPFVIQPTKNGKSLMIELAGSYIEINRKDPKWDIQLIFTALETNAAALTLDLQNA